MKMVTLENLDKMRHMRQEAFRALRTNIAFCGDEVKVILLTSSVSDEGKSTVAFDLARSLAESKKSVLLIDADMRKSVLAGRMRAITDDGDEICGLSHYLSGHCELKDCLYGTQIPRMYMVFAGYLAPDPTELLEKRYFGELISFGRNNFDYVIIDAPPLGMTIDAAVIAKECDGAALIVAQGKTTSRMLGEVKRQLELSGVRILGVVMTMIKIQKSKYGYYKYGGNYYGGGYYSS